MNHLEVTYRELDQNQSSDFLRLIYNKLKAKNRENIIIMLKSEFDRMMIETQNLRSDFGDLQRAAEETQTELVLLLKEEK